MAVPPTPRYGIDFPATLGPETETPPPAETPLAVTSTTGNPTFEDIYHQSEEVNRRRREFDRERFERAQQALMEQRMGPSLSERLGHLSAAFFAPKRMRGYAGAMDKIMPVLAADETADRQGAEQRATALRELQDQYGERGLSADDADLQHQMKLLELRMDAQKDAAATQWSENYGRFLPKNKPVVLERGTLDGKTVFQYSDGTMRIPQEDGTMQVYDAGGRFLGTSDAEGNPVDASR